METAFHIMLRSREVQGSSQTFIVNSRAGSLNLQLGILVPILGYSSSLSP